ncbi:MAG: hypothetical protein IT443_07255 [Phycisphaeraceae bacterium]|nr:hypothetical protein [Phycisphaeraceae bacterium]
MLPPLPAWENLHPLIVHFPVALLLVAPIFILLAILCPPQRLGFVLAALVLLWLGTFGSILAIETGEAAEGMINQTPQITAVLHEHEEFAEWTRDAFLALSVLYSAWVILHWRVKSFARPKLVLLALAIFLLLTLAADLLVINTGHRGGRMVHELGVHAMP